MVGIIAIVVVLGGLIFFHELGHFLVARAFGIGVKKFSIGFGPKLFSIQGKKTEYQLALVPLGGFVALLGEGGGDEEIPAPFTREESFALRPPLHRLLVILAGPVFNIILAWFIYWGLMVGGMMMLPEISAVELGSPAEQAGITPGDRILSINGKTIRWWDDIAFRVNTEKSEELAVTIDHKGEEKTLSITPAVFTATKPNGAVVSMRLLGVASAQKYYQAPILKGAIDGLHETWRNMAFTGEMLKMTFSGAVPAKDVGGPVLIAQVVHSQVSNKGLLSVLGLTALLSINLGLLNLLPIPALDGGHIFFSIFEIIFKRPVPLKIQEYTTYAGFALLLLIMILATGNDIHRWLFR